MSKIGPRLVARLKKIKDHRARIAGSSNCVVLEDRHRRTAKEHPLRLGWLQRLVHNSVRRWRRVGVEGGLCQGVVPEPESRADYLARVGLLGYGIDPLHRRSRPAGKSRTSQIEAVPEHVNGAAFAHKAA